MAASKPWFASRSPAPLERATIGGAAHRKLPASCRGPLATHCCSFGSLEGGTGAQREHDGLYGSPSLRRPPPRPALRLARGLGSCATGSGSLEKLRQCAGPGGSQLAPCIQHGVKPECHFADRMGANSRFKAGVIGQTPAMPCHYFSRPGAAGACAASCSRSNDIVAIRVSRPFTTPAVRSLDILPPNAELRSTSSPQRLDL